MDLIINPLSFSGTDAFAHKDKLKRTPPANQRPTHAAMDTSYGPLSSTRMEDKFMKRRQKVEKDAVTTRLFSSHSGGSGGGIMQ